jgi:hypothetical protein
MNTSEPVQANAARVRPDHSDDPTIWEVDDALWARRAPLLVDHTPRKKPGPHSTLHARFQEWVRRGVFSHLWAVLLEAYDDLVGIDWQWQAADGCLVKAPLGKRGRLARRKRPGAPPPTAANAGPSVIC